MLHNAKRHSCCLTLSYPEISYPTLQAGFQFHVWNDYINVDTCHGMYVSSCQYPIMACYRCDAARRLCQGLNTAGFLDLNRLVQLVFASFDQLVALTCQHLLSFWEKGEYL